MFTLTLPTARKHGRQRMRRAAWLTFGNGAAPVRCMVWDYSEGGCRIAAPHALGLPTVFVLNMDPNPDLRRHCRIVWQRGG